VVTKYGITSLNRKSVWFTLFFHPIQGMNWQEPEKHALENQPTAIRYDLFNTKTT
jgi:hypothetical protein